MSLFVLCAISLLLGGCASIKHPKTVTPSGFLVDYSRLTPGTEDQMMLRWVSPNADVKKYTKVLVDPCQVVVKDKKSPEELADIQKAANEGYQKICAELGKDYVLVNKPEPGTLRIQVAVTNAQRSSPARNVISSVLPIGLGVSLAKDATTGKPTGVGEASFEIRALDAMNGEILAEGVDRRVGGKSPSAWFDSWHDVEAALTYWAQRTRYVLCRGRGGDNCVKPE
jgi:hypothetical protein